MKNKSTKLVIVGIFSAIAASLCCITPILAVIAGASGAASAFLWLEPLRPYLIGITVLVLGIAWYQKLKPAPKDEIQCADCDEPGKTSFWRSKKFLAIVTGLVIATLLFPYYGHHLVGENGREVIVVNSENREVLEMKVKGMTCKGCETTIEHEVFGLNGIIDVKADHSSGVVVVEFDNTAVTKEEIINRVNSTGYKVIHH